VTLRDVTERRRAEAALRASEARFRSVYQHAAFGLAVMDGSGRLIEANPALSGMLASGVEVLRDQLLTDITHPEDSEDVADAFRRFAETRTDEEKMEVRLTCGNGLVMWARLLLTTAPGENEGPPLIIGLVEDITENRKTSAALHLAASVFENTQESIVIFDANGSVERVNRAYCRSSGYTDREVSGLDLSHLTSARYERDFFDGIERELAKAGVWQGEILIRRKSGELIPSWASLSVVRRSDGGIQNFVGILTDLTERKEKEEAIWRHANFDQVTSLPNRRLFQDRLNQAINQTGRRGGRMALFFLDLDRFKQVNDTLGHQAGDILLNRVAKRLLRAVRTTDTVARLGGDEFTVIVENVHEPEDLSRIAQGIIAEVARTVSLPGGEIKVSTSIGIAVYPDDGADSEELIRNADAALYHAKDRGRDNYQFFTEDLKDRLTRRIAFEHSLRQAIDTDQLFVHYQPQVEAVTGALCGAEALVRWRREDGSIGMPDDFIGLAEETGIIVALGQAVLKRVAEDMSQWSRDGHILPRIGVNVSARQFSARQRLPDLVEEIFEANGTPLDRLTIEITESSLMTDRETVLPQLVHLANKGVKVALDDFGKGYSSLSRLKNLPIQALKMDKDFVDGLPDDPESLAMATAILGMARGLGIDVIAEGVELKAQAQCLTDLGCHHFQGYLFARPMNATDFLSFCQSKAR
ncbi:MAG: putative bifunctional diguanylate cyclase/phosphodiesterase, partial [Rhodospirillales bacterium]